MRARRREISIAEQCRKAKKKSWVVVDNVGDDCIEMISVVTLYAAAKKTIENQCCTNVALLIRCEK